MRRLSALIISITLAVGCVPSHFASIAGQAAARALTCESSRAVEVEQLSSAGFLVQTCEGPQYFRCKNVRHTMGGVQCCVRVESEEQATSLLYFGSWEGATCSEGT
ncbi:MAG: hypothetical protein ACHREM_03165 [Polyangiales bacterium]